MSHQLCLQRLAVLPEAGQCCTWLYMIFPHSQNKQTMQNRQQRASPAWKLVIWFYAPSPVFGCHPRMFGRHNIQPSACGAAKVFPSHFCGQAALPQAECEVLWVLDFVPKKPTLLAQATCILAFEPQALD